VIRVFLNTYGTEVRLRQEACLHSASRSVSDVLSALRVAYPAPLERLLQTDLSPVAGVAILLNGRNLRSLDESSLTVQDGDEITFTVMLSGG
jgi:molybdopterin converting factor small subunit